MAPKEINRIPSVRLISLDFFQTNRQKDEYACTMCMARYL